MLPESQIFRARHGAMPHSDARLLCYKADSLTWQQMSLGMEKLTFASVNKVRGARGTWGINRADRENRRMLPRRVPGEAASICG
jgi:hypothetical protein